MSEIKTHMDSEDIDPLEKQKIICIAQSFIKDFPIFAILWRILLFRQGNTDQQLLIQ